MDFVHDLNHAEHRAAARLSPANVATGGRIDWKAFGLAEAFEAMVDGTKVWMPCLIHLPEAHAHLFEPKP